MGNFTGLVLYIVFTAIFFYLLYGVIRAGVRDGIRAADKRRADEALPGPPPEASS